MSSNLKVNTIQPSSGDTVSIAGIASITSSVSIASSCTATTFYGDGSNLTGVSGLSVGNQADNRLITCTGTTDTLYGESNLTFASNVLTLSGTFNVSGEVQIAENIVHTGDGNTAIGFPANDTIRCITAGVERLRIDSSGRVLIGTTTEGESTADDLTIATSGTTGMTIRSGTSGEGNIFFSDGTSGAAEYAGTIQYSHASNYMLFFANAAERLRITSDGNVGINDTDPSYKLNVIGDNTAYNGIGMLKGIIGVQNDTTAFGSSPTAGISFQTKYRTGPDVPLDVAAIWGGKENTTNGDKDGYMGFATREEGGSGSQERMRITSDGKVVAGGSGAGYPSRLQSHGAGELLDLNSTSGAGKIRFYESGAGRFNIETLNGPAGIRFLDALNNVEAMRIHANGRITTPNQPMYSGIGYVGGGTQVQTNIYAIRPSAVYANLGSHFNTSTGVFTCPIAGRYLCIGAMGRRATAFNWNGFYLIHNGATKGDMWFPPARDNGSNPASPAAFRADQFTYNPTNLSAVLTCAANDTISFAFHNSYAAPLDSSGNYAQFILIG